MLRFIKTFVIKYWHYYLSGLIALVITNFALTIIPLKIKTTIDLLTTQSTFAPIKTQLIHIIALSLSLACTRTLSRILIFYPGRYVEHDLRNVLFNKLLNLSQSFYRNEKIGDLISRMINDIQSLRATAALAFLHIINTIMIYSFVIYQMIKINPTLTGWIILPIPLAMLSISLFVKTMYKCNHQCQQSLGELTNFFIESFNNIKTIKTAVAEQAIKVILTEKNNDYYHKNIKLAKIRAGMFPFIGIISSIGAFILLLKGGPLIIKNQLTIGEFVAFSAYFASLGWPTAALGWIVNIIQRGKAAWNRIALILDTPATFQGKLPIPTSTPFTITCKNLNFSYDNTKSPNLTNVNLSIKSGDIIGIFGQSGSGKSTLTQLLAGLEQPPANQLFINSTCIHQLNINDYLKHIAYVSQNPFLFSKSIAENIVFKPEHTSLASITDLACVTTDINLFPHQEKTIVGEKGIILSGGQRSRIALARALNKQADILILDDILAALDHKTEHAVIKNILQQKQPHQIIILVSHRISALTQTNKIFMMQQGTITQTGTHTELLKHNTHYKHTWTYQQMMDQL
tara:strand:- start:686 stop:2401 length:1716 start_codon:yes stop_codon:yes gene_type:complete